MRFNSKLHDYLVIVIIWQRRYEMLHNLLADGTRSLRDSTAIDRLKRKNADKKWSFETDMSSPERGDGPHKHRFTGHSLVGQLNLHQLMHRPHVAVLRDLLR